MKFEDNVFQLNGNNVDAPAARGARNHTAQRKRREDFSEIEGRLLADGEKFPDLEKQNAATPKEEWFKTAYSNGQLKGPWDNVHEAHFLDMRDMSRQLFSTSTKGGVRAIDDLAHRIKNMRRFRGARVYPEVELSHTYMPTDYGGRERPQFKIIRWLMPGADGAMVEVPADPTKPLPTLTVIPHAKEVAEPSRQEELADAIPH